MVNTTNKYKIVIWMMMAVLSLNACNSIRPFFIKNKKKEERKEKRAVKKIERKETKIEKKQDKVDEMKNAITKIDSLPVFKRDSLIIKSADSAFANHMIVSKKITYNTYQCKAKMHFESDKEKQNFNINFRIKKDTIIWASINAPIIGEIARAVITKDSVKAIERINKKLYLYSYNDIQKLINLQVDFNTLQELIIGNAIATDGEVTDIKELGALSNIIIKGKDFVNQLTYTKGDSTMKKMQLQTSRPSSSSSLLIAMNRYEIYDARLFPTLRQYNILDVKGAVQLDMDINKAEFDQVIDFPFSIPKNYKLQD